MLTLRERFDARWTPNLVTGCHEWRGQIDRGGYGRYNAESAHRLAWKMHAGQIPEGLELDHLCRVRRCVNPLHLEAVTQRENILRGRSNPVAVNARKTHCPQGHPLVKGNLYFNAGTKHRTCRKCKCADQRRYYNERHDAD